MSESDDKSKDEITLIRPREEVRSNLKTALVEGEKIIAESPRHLNALGILVQRAQDWLMFVEDLLESSFRNLKYASEQDISSLQFDAHLATEYDFSYSTEPNVVLELRRIISHLLRVLRNTLWRLDMIDKRVLNDKEDSQGELVNCQTDNVFVVHGHDNGAKEAVARVISKLDLSPVILHEKANSGRTIIEKLETEAKTIGFAVVILTPDDEGRRKGDDRLGDRARQNVILELGLFIGLLGRHRVCALCNGDLELPSDIDGVLYVPMDEHGAWQTKLAKELKSAGYQIDMNLL